jgi:hypothetical protein
VTKRLYLTAAATPYTPATRRGAWDDTTTTVIQSLQDTKSGANAAIGKAETNVATAWDVLLGRWVSPGGVILQAGTLAGSMTLTSTQLESAAGAAMFTHVHVYVTVGDTDVVRGTLLADGVGPLEWPTAQAAVGETYTLTGVAVQPGDHIVVELGYRANNTVTTSFTGTVRYGGTAADLVAGGTNLNANSPWVEFTDTNSVLSGAAFADTAAGADATSAVKSGARTAADVAAATDVALTTRGRSAADVAAASDAATLGPRTSARSPSDSAQANDQVVATMTWAEIQDYQFVVPVVPHVPFGLGQTIVVEKFNPGPAEDRAQDVLSPVADVRHFGTDLRTPPTWSWDLYTDVHTPADALGWAQNLEEVWQAEDVRLTPNAVVPLQYKVAGRLRRVYGRPRRFSMVPDFLPTGRVSIFADFALAENVYYDDTEQALTVRTVPSVVSGTGFTMPFTMPLTVGVAGDSPRIEQAVVQGRRPTWVDIVFKGPSVDPWVQIGDRRWGLRGSILAGSAYNVRMSGKPWQQGIMQADGTWRPEMLDPRARLSQLRLPPGVYSVRYGAYDPTGQSTATLSWRSAYGTM